MTTFPSLEPGVPIVQKESGAPSDYFLQYLQRRGGALTELEAILLRKIISSDGSLSVANGILGESGDIDLTANASTILDKIGSDWGDVLFRGETGWEVLAPGTAGHVLKTNGVGADPEWVAQSGGGGGGWFAGGMVTGESVGGGAFATKGTCFTPSVNVEVEYVLAYLDAASGGDAYDVTIATVNPATGEIGTVLATSATFNSPSTNPVWCKAEFASPVSLTAGVDYIIVLSLTSGTGTTNNRIIFGDTAPNMPIENMNYLSFNYNTTGLTDSQSASSSTSVGDLYALFPCGSAA